MTASPDAPVTIEAPVLDSSACHGPCMAKYRETGKGVIRIGEPYLCGACSRQLRNELSAIEDMVAEMKREADGHRSSTGADAAIRAHRHAGGSGTPAPAVAVEDELVAALRRWMVIKRPRAVRLGFVSTKLRELVNWLIENADAYEDDQECAGAFAGEVHSWHARLQNRTKTGAPLIHKPLPCPRCQMRGLEQERGADVVKCRECGRIMSEKEYADLAADGAESAEKGAEPSPAPRGSRARARKPAA